MYQVPVNCTQKNKIIPICIYFIICTSTEYLVPGINSIFLRRTTAISLFCVLFFFMCIEKTTRQP